MREAELCAAMRTANRLVTIRMLKACDDQAPRLSPAMAKIIAPGSPAATAAASLAPTAATADQLAARYSSAMTAIAMYVARETVRFGSRASSEKIAVASKPRNVENTNASATPGVPLKISAGENDRSGYSPGPTLTKTATMIATSSSVSSASSTPSSRTLACTPKKHSANTAASPIIEQTGQDTLIPSSESSAAEAKKPKNAPMRITDEKYAMSAT